MPAPRKTRPQALPATLWAVHNAKLPFALCPRKRFCRPHLRTLVYFGPSASLNPLPKSPNGLENLSAPASVLTLTGASNRQSSDCRCRVGVVLRAENAVVNLTNGGFTGRWFHAIRFRYPSYCLSAERIGPRVWRCATVRCACAPCVDPLRVRCATQAAPSRREHAAAAAAPARIAYSNPCPRTGALLSCAASFSS